jgi:hypothetical protein
MVGMSFEVSLIYTIAIALFSIEPEIYSNKYLGLNCVLVRIAKRQATNLRQKFYQFYGFL